MNVSAPRLEGKPAVTVRRCLIRNCTDGILSQAGFLFVEETTIRDCSCDGIFSNDFVKLRNSTVGNVGRNGIKGRSGWDGTNCRIQPSQWDQLGTGGGGGY